MRIIYARPGGARKIREINWVAGNGNEWACVSSVHTLPGRENKENKNLNEADGNENTWEYVELGVVL